MGVSKRRANSNSKVLPDDFAQLKEQFLIDVRPVVVMEEIPADLVINWDQTAMKIVPSCSWTMEKRGNKHVEIAGIDDKRQVTAVFECSHNTDDIRRYNSKVLSKNIAFPADWHSTCTANHWSNEDTMLDYVKLIVVPYITKKREQLGLSINHCALALFNVFKGQCTAFSSCVKRTTSSMSLFQVIVLTDFIPSKRV